MWKHSVQSLVKPLGLLQLIVEREAPDVILVVVRNGFPGSASTFNLEQEVFFPFVLCYQVLALRFNKNPVLFHAGAVPPARGRRGARLKAFAAVKRVQHKLAFVADEVCRFVFALQGLHVRSKVCHKRFLL